MSKQERGILAGNRDILFLLSDTGSLKAIEFLENFISPNLQGRKADLVDIATNFGTDSTSTMAAIKLRKFDGDGIVLWDRQQ